MIWQKMKPFSAASKLSNFSFEGLTERRFVSKATGFFFLFFCGGSN